MGINRASNINQLTDVLRRVTLLQIICHNFFFICFVRASSCSFSSSMSEMCFITGFNNDRMVFVLEPSRSVKNPWTSCLHAWTADSTLWSFKTLTIAKFKLWPKQPNQSQGKPRNSFFMFDALSVVSWTNVPLWFSTLAACFKKFLDVFSCVVLWKKNCFEAEGLQFPIWWEEMNCESYVWFSATTTADPNISSNRKPHPFCYLFLHMTPNLCTSWEFHSLKRIFLMALCIKVLLCSLV